MAVLRGIEQGFNLVRRLYRLSLTLLLCPGLQPDCRITRKQVRFRVLCASVRTRTYPDQRYDLPNSS